jgi:hypothetical protein
MAKRVSLKGRGADLFFGDFAPSAESEGASGNPVHEADPSAAEPIVLPAIPRVDGPDGVAAAATATASQDPSRPTAPDQKPITSFRHDSKRASKLASTQTGEDPDVVEAIRRVVKVPGREVAFVRLTPEEKAQLADVVYTYKRQGMKTTETEVNRIALNYLLHDYREHGEHSVLARVLAALLA